MVRAALTGAAAPAGHHHRPRAGQDAPRLRRRRDHAASRRSATSARWGSCRARRSSASPPSSSAACTSTTRARLHDARRGAQSYFGPRRQDLGDRRQGRGRRPRRPGRPGASQAAIARPDLRVRDWREINKNALRRAQARTLRHVHHPVDGDHRRELLHHLHSAPDGHREGQGDRHPQGARRERRLDPPHLHDRGGHHRRDRHGRSAWPPASAMCTGLSWFGLRLDPDVYYIDRLAHQRERGRLLHRGGRWPSRSARSPRCTRPRRPRSSGRSTGSVTSERCPRSRARHKNLAPARESRRRRATRDPHGFALCTDRGSLASQEGPSSFGSLALRCRLRRSRSRRLAQPRRTRNRT